MGMRKEKGKYSKVNFDKVNFYISSAFYPMVKFILQEHGHNKLYQIIHLKSEHL